MFSEACANLFTIGLMATRSLLNPCYGAVSTHPTGMLSCLNYFKVLHKHLVKSKEYRDENYIKELCLATGLLIK